jgi:hypothetical protein
MFAICSHMADDASDDGQLHSLGLLEQLREETKRL